jgi:hypothetical protein
MTKVLIGLGHCSSKQLARQYFKGLFVRRFAYRANTSKSISSAARNLHNSLGGTWINDIKSVKQPVNPWRESTKMGTIA